MAVGNQKLTSPPGSLKAGARWNQKPTSPPGSLKAGARWNHKPTSPPGSLKAGARWNQKPTSTPESLKVGARWNQKPTSLPGSLKVGARWNQKLTSPPGSLKTGAHAAPPHITMPKGPSVYSGFSYAPLTEDVEELLARFQQSDSVRFQVFSSLWRDRSFSQVFLGLSGGDLKRFSMICMSTAVRYFMPPHGYQVRVGGLYLMFAFYHTQRTCPPVKIRLALKDWVHVQDFLRDSVNGDHLDVVYIFQKLLADKAFHFTAMPQVLNFQKKLRGPQTEEVHLSRDRGVQDLVSSDLLDELSGIQDHYEKLKVAVGCRVSMAHRDFSSHLMDCVSQETTVPSETSEDKKLAEDEKDEESSSRARLLSSIKQRSYGNFQEASGSRRHRKLEVVDLSSSDVQQVQDVGPSQKKKPVSLRARTQKTLVVTEERSSVRRWLLSAPEGRNPPEGQSRT